MSHTSYTLQLDESWDLSLDSVGHIAFCEGPAALAQSAANECRLFTNDACFAMSRGIPHFIVSLDTDLPQSVLRYYLRRAVMLVDGIEEVTDIRLESVDKENRTLSGEIQFTTTEGSHVAIEL